MATTYTWANEYIKVIDRLWEEDAYDEGKQVLDSILLEEPDFAKAHAYAGWYAHYQSKDRKLARLHYELALKFEPSLGYTYYHFAELLIEQKDEARMKQLLDLGMDQEDADKANLYNDVGRVLERNGKFAQASAFYKEGLKFTMNYFTMQNMKANRKRVRSKYHLFGRWYSFLL